MDNLPLIRPNLIGQTKDIRCAMSTREGGVSAGALGFNMSYAVGDKEESVEKNRRLFYSHLGIDPHRIAIPRQRHTSRVEVVDSPGEYDSTDALTTDRSGLWLAVSVADCVPVFMVDKAKRAIAVVHAGWRGASAGIVTKTIERMRITYGTNSSDLIVFIGPSAGACCYEVGNDVARHFGDAVIMTRGTGKYLDLKAENTRQLVEEGVLRSKIEVSPLCTICNPNTLHSFRRDKERSGRMMGVIGIVE